MISLIRKGLNKKSLQVIVWVLLLALFGLPSFLSIFKRFSQPTITSIATVNGYEIDTQTYKKKVAEEEQRLLFFRQQFGPQADEFLKQIGMHGNPQELALNALVQDALVKSAADSLKISIAPSYIEHKIQDPQFLLQSLSHALPQSIFNKETGAIDFQLLGRYLQHQGISMAEFEKMIEEALQKDVLFKLVQGSLYIPKPALKELYAQEYRNKKFLIVPFSRASALQEVKKAMPTDDELKKYFDIQNKETHRYWTPEKRTISLWTFTPSSYGIQVTDKEVSTYYAKHKSLYQNMDLAKATSEIKEKLQIEKFKRIFNLDAPRIISGSNQDSALFDQYIANKKAHKVVKNLSLDQSLLARKAFATMNGKKSFLLNEKDGVILHVDSIEKSFLPAFNSIRAKVLDDYYASKAQELLENKLMGLKDSDEKTKRSELTGWVNAQKPETYDALKKQGLPVTRILRMTHKGDFIDAFTTDNAYAIRLEDIEPFDEASFDAKKEELLKGLSSRYAQQLAQSFIANLQKNATIITNKPV